MSVTPLVGMLDSIVADVESQSLHGKNLVLAHLSRSRVRLMFDGAGNPEDPLTQWRDAVNDMRSATEALFLAVVREVAQARGASIINTAPVAIRDQLVLLGVIEAGARDLVAKTYGVASSKSAHPGLPSRSEAEFQSGVLLAAMGLVLRGYEASASRGFALPTEHSPSSADTKRLAQHLHRKVAQRTDLAVNVTVDAGGVRSVSASPQMGDLPIQFTIRPMSDEAQATLRRVLEYGESGVLRGQPSSDTFLVEPDPRVAALLEPITQWTELRIEAPPPRPGRLVVTGFVPPDVPHVEFASLGRADGRFRLILRSALLPHTMIFDLSKADDIGHVHIEYKDQASAAVHVRWIHLMRAALATPAAELRVPPEDVVVARLPLGEVARHMPAELLDQNMLQWYEVLSRLEEYFGVSLPPHRGWDEATFRAAHFVDQLLQAGYLELEGSVTLSVAPPVARRIAEQPHGADAGFVMEGEPGRMFALPNLPQPFSLMHIEVYAPVLDPSPTDLALIDDAAEVVRVTFSSPRPLIVRLVDDRDRGPRSI